MALTGMVLVGFVAVHMVGNLLMYRGAVAMNGYAAMLKSNLALLWGVRGVLLVALILHVHAAVSLTRQANAARHDRYEALRHQASTRSARLMRWGGALLALFVVFHILQFTTGTAFPSRFLDGEAYQNVVRGFSLIGVALFYLVAMVALALHLHHGVASVFQTLGANHPNLERARHGLAIFLAVAIPLGFASVPLGVLLGWIR